MSRRDGSEREAQAAAGRVAEPPLRAPGASDVAPAALPGDPPTGEVDAGTASGSWPNAWVIDEGSGERPQSTVLAPPSPERVPLVLLRLSREVGIEMQDDEIVHAFVEAMRELFPGRRFAVRLLAASAGGAHSKEVALFYASGRLKPSIPPPGGARSSDAAMRDPLVLEQRAADRHGLPAAELERVGVRLCPRYEPFFEPGAEGFDVPLTDGPKLIGLLSVEVPAGFAVPAWDPPILVPLALEMAAKLKSARLVRESSYLRDYLVQIVERANAPIVVLDAERRVENANLAFLTVTGSSREQWIGRDFVELLPDSERGRALSALDAAARGQASTNVELRLPRTGGHAARVAFNTASITSPDGDIAGIVAIGRDMTEVRDLEEQIIHAEKLATLGQLAAGVVHELNNPLTSISVYSEYLLTKGRRGGAEPGDLEKLSRISEAAARMLRFTRDLVTYARPSSEEPSRISMAEVIDQGLLFCDHVISEAGVRVERRYEHDLPALWAVRGQLHQVFINLFTNACHAISSRARSGQITLSVERDPEGGIVVRVGDDGPGIAPEHVDHIFEPFFSTKGEGKGTGLGLSIVRNIVQQHGGTIEVTSGHGQAPAGTTFTLRFPLRPFALATSSIPPGD